MDWKTLGQWTMIAVAFVSMLIHNERRLTTVETSINEQMKGYVIAFESINHRLNRMETLLDRMNERGR